MKHSEMLPPVHNLWEKHLYIKGKKASLEMSSGLIPMHHLFLLIFQCSGTPRWHPTFLNLDTCTLESVTDLRNGVTYSGRNVRASHETTVCHKLSSLDGHPTWLSGKESVCQCRRRRFHLWVRKIPWRRKWQPTPGILAWKSPWTEEPGGYSPRSQKEWEATERACHHYIACFWDSALMMIW